MQRKIEIEIDPENPQNLEILKAYAEMNGITSLGKEFALKSLTKNRAYTRDPNSRFEFRLGLSDERP